MASKLASTCGPCSYRKIGSDASMWCVDCKEGFCGDCKESHSALKILRSHNLIPYEDAHKLPEIAQNVRDTCNEHNRQLEVYCTDHQHGCCIKCSTSDHKNCTQISPMEEITKNAKSSVAVSNIQERLNALISKLEMIIEKKYKSLKDIGDQSQHIKRDVQGTQAKIEEKLKSLFEKVIIEADRIRKDSETKSYDVIETLENNLKVAHELKVCVEQIIENGSNLQLFLCLNELDSLITAEENRMSALLEMEELDCTELHFKYNDDFKKLASVECIGRVTTEKKPLEMPLQSFEQCALTASANQLEHQARNINKVTLTKKSRMALPTDSFITNCLVLQNDCMVFTDFSKKKRLLLYDPNANFLRDIGMESKPFDMTEITDKVIAITLTEAEKVVFLEFQLNEDIIVKEMKMAGQCFGIDYCDHRLAVAVKKRGIQIFTADGTQLRTIPFDCIALIFTRSDITYVGIGDNVLRCCSVTGKHIWELEMPVTKFYNYPSITEDGTGCLYITDSQKDAVFIVANNRSSWRKLLQQSDGIYYVNGIYVNQRREELLLCTKRDKEAVLYGIKEDS